MEFSSQNLLRTLGLFMLSQCLVEYSFAQGSFDAKTICKDSSSVDRSMALAAGYDLDKLCSSFNSLSTKNADKKPATPEVVPRSSVSSEKSNALSEIIAPVAVSGVDKPPSTRKLKLFGYDLFASAPSTFAPNNNVPVSPDYLLGPGDSLDFLFYGKTNESFSVEINRDGIVNFPDLGPVGLAGLSFAEAKKMLQARINTQLIGAQVSISMGKLRSMQIFVLGEAFKPGAYTVSSLSTITHALISSGGVSDIASLRNIQLKRAGKVISTLDLYDLLIVGDTSKDIRLQDSDVVYIPTVGDLVSIDGQVLRPAIYELNGETTASELIELAGGLGPKAFSQSARIERINGDGFMTVVDIDLSQKNGKDLPLKGGDHLRIDGIIDRKKSIVSLVGYVYHPGQFKWRSGMRVSDILGDVDKFPTRVDLDYALISREVAPVGEIKVIKIDLRGVLEGNKQSDIKLETRDTIHIFSLDSDRSSNLKNVFEKLNSQARSGEFAKVVTITGDVRLPGKFPLTNEMRIADLVFAGGGFSVTHTPVDYAILVRKVLPKGDIEVINISLDELFEDLEGDQNLTLSPQDKLLMFAADESRDARLAPVMSELKKQARTNELAKTVRIAGTVKFPGEYPLVENMDISALVKAAGGFTQSAYTQAAELSRINLSNPEIAQVNAIPFSIKGEGVVSALKLKPLDRVSFRAIPEFRETSKIALQGEVQFPGVYYFEQGEMLGSIIQRAGGFTDLAHVDAAFFTRISLKNREREEIQRLKSLLDEQVAAERLLQANSEFMEGSQQDGLKNQALKDLDSAQAVGRLVIPLREIMSMRADDILLEEGDRLLVPKFRQEVTVIGEVHRPVSYLFNPKFSINNYLEQSGGLKDNANKDAIYIVKASGQVIVPKSNLFRFLGPSERIQPGDTIVVPLDPDVTSIEGIPLLAEISKILYQTALGALALNSFK